MRGCPFFSFLKNQIFPALSIRSCNLPKNLTSTKSVLTNRFNSKIAQALQTSTELRLTEQFIRLLYYGRVTGRKYDRLVIAGSVKIACHLIYFKMTSSDARDWTNSIKRRVRPAPKLLLFREIS
jgi:hypothetical protein